jgi:hypothetical protein
MRTIFQIPAFFILLAGILFFSPGCRSKDPLPETGYPGAVEDSVSKMASALTLDLSQIGPAAWLHYFEDSPDFFMAVDGKMAFPNYQTADHFITDTLVKAIRKINLQWQSLRINPLSPSLASMAARYHEDLFDSAGKSIQANGYFTATAVFTAQGWKLKNIHWSSEINK